MVSVHRGMNLSTVVFRDSVTGKSSGLLWAYRLSLPGKRGSSLPPSNSAARLRGQHLEQNLDSMLVSVITAVRAVGAR